MLRRSYVALEESTWRKRRTCAMRLFWYILNWKTRRAATTTKLLREMPHRIAFLNLASASKILLQFYLPSTKIETFGDVFVTSSFRTKRGHRGETKTVFNMKFLPAIVKNRLMNTRKTNTKNAMVVNEEWAKNEKKTCFLLPQWRSSIKAGAQHCNMEGSLTSMMSMISMEKWAKQENYFELDCCNCLFVFRYSDHVRWRFCYVGIRWSIDHYLIFFPAEAQKSSWSLTTT